MANQTSAIAAALVVTGLVTGSLVAGFGVDLPSAAPSSPSHPTSAPARPVDYSNLLIPASDIAVPDDSFKLDQSAQAPNQVGIQGSYSNQDGNRKISMMISVLPNAAMAVENNDNNTKTVDMFVQDTPPNPIDFGTGGVMAVGQAEGGRSSAVVMFAEGRATVLIVFDSPPDDPLSPDFVLDVARKQDAAIKAGLPA